MSNLASLATRHAGRPLLLTPRAALDLANRVRAVDPQAVARPGRFSALIRKLSGNDLQRQAMEDDDYEPVPMEERLAYSPLYAGEADDLGFCWALKDGVAMMQIDKPLLDRGEIFCGEVYHGYDTILQGLRQAMADDRVKGVFIREATPGGVVASGLPALAEYMRENSARGGGKPIHVYADMACSAGYWIASSADRIVSGRVGLVGSIGAVIVHENWSGALEKAGIEVTPIQFGDAKTDGAWWDKLSDRARADLQAEIDQCGRDFVADVIAGRPQLTEEDVLATQAAVFMGNHDEPARSALALKLIDGLSSEEAAFAALRDQVAGSAPPSAPGSGTPSAAAPRGRAPASAAKEAPVAKHTKAGGKPSANSPLAKARTAMRQAQAEVRRLEAEEADEDKDQTDAEIDEDDVDQTEAADDADDENDDAEVSSDGDDDEDGQTEAAKIAGSAEAEANPKAATAAIRDGLSYAQFKGQMKAMAAGGQGRLSGQLSGGRRLGADSPPKKVEAGLDHRAIYARRKARAQR